MRRAMLACAVAAMAATLVEAQPGEVHPVYRVLSEVAPNALDWGQDTGEWVELRNPSVSHPCSVGKLWLFDNNTFDQELEDYPYDPFVPGMVIPAQGYAIVMDMKKRGQYYEGETYDAVCAYIYAHSMQDKVIFLCPTDEAIGNGLADDDDMLGVRGHVVFHTPLGDRSVAVHEKVEWTSPVDETHSFQWNGYYWGEHPWTPGGMND